MNNVKKNSTHLLIILLGIIFLFPACDKLDLLADVPSCIENEIREIKKEEVRNPRAQVWKWEVDGNTYYYITSDCCDQFNYLFDEDCNVVCAPDGGFSGNGDGNCPDFTGEIKYALVWEDDRNKEK